MTGRVEKIKRQQGLLNVVNEHLPVVNGNWLCDYTNHGMAALNAWDRGPVGSTPGWGAMGGGAYTATTQMFSYL